MILNVRDAYSNKTHSDEKILTVQQGYHKAVK